MASQLVLDYKSTTWGGKKLYIVGNGFDLYHGMKTSWSDFCLYLQKHNSKIYDFLREYYSFNTENGLWSDFEADLRTFNHSTFLKNINCTDPLSESFKPSQIFLLEDKLLAHVEGIVDEIKESICDWLTEHADLSNKKELLSLESDAIFLTFNYTNTLEELYAIPKENILHIHNSIHEDGEDLILGHNVKIDAEPEFDKEGNSTRTPYTDAQSLSKSLLHVFYKNTEEIIKEHSVFFENLTDVEEVIVIGHSLNQIDMPYFEWISQVVGDVKWTVSFHYDDEPPRMCKALSMAVKDVSFFKYLNTPSADHL